MNETMRERAFSWDAPADVLQGIIGREHLAWMQDMRDGKIPGAPVARMLAMYPEIVEGGRVTFAMNAEEWMANPVGVIHGGMTATLLDTVMTLAVMTKLPRERVCTTLDLSLHYVRPLFPTGEKIVAEGIVVHTGATVGTAEGKLYDERRRLIAHGTATLAIIDATRQRRGSSPDS
jgi:uncharacterized protein (TIGR00369 family)